MPFVHLANANIHFDGAVTIGLGSFAVEDHLRSILGTIRGRGSIAVLYSCSTIELMQLNRTNRTQSDSPDNRTTKRFC